MLIYGKIQDSVVYYFESGLPVTYWVSFRPIGKMLRIFEILYERPNSAQSKSQIEIGIGGIDIRIVAIEIVVFKQ
jgi:hypothetical protein